MEMNKTITLMSTCGAPMGDASLSTTVEESFSSVMEHVEALRDNAENHSDTPIKVTWTTFRTRAGHMVEKCAIEWSYGGVRMVDVVWVKRGQRWT